MDTRTITHADHTDTETLFGEVWAVTACNCELVTKSIEQTGVDNMEFYHRPRRKIVLHDLVSLEEDVSVRDARIAELEAQNKRLVEALESVCWAVEHGGFPEDSIGLMKAQKARDLLAELSK